MFTKLSISVDCLNLEFNFYPLINVPEIYKFIFSQKIAVNMYRAFFFLISPRNRRSRVDCERTTRVNRKIF
jgi:hypothetical protein